MKLSSKLVLTICAATSAGAHAELRVLNDDDMRASVGQAGISIEIDANVSIGEIAYKDQGFVFINNFQLGGAGLVQSLNGQPVTQGMNLDNLLLTVDIAGAGGSDLARPWGLAKLTSPDLTTTVTTVSSTGEINPGIDDGDLVISVDAINQSEFVDFGLVIDRVSLGDSTLLPGQGATNTGTAILSGLRAQGIVGPTDIVIDSDSNRMNINSYFTLSGSVKMDFYIPILFQYKDMAFDFRIHNSRGEDTVIVDNAATGEQVSYAHIQADIGANADTAKGLYVNITDLSADIDMTNVTFGTAPAIGDINFTDLTVTAAMNVYGH